ncbi:MAG: hypothetical protein MUF01_09780, partial [Bryobacterales bacterium]|nr:hypothetical protein [Bryobacterales bacterium]
MASPLAAQQSVVGLLAIPELFGDEVCLPFPPSDVQVHAAPGGPPIGTLRVRNPWLSAGASRCDELEVNFLTPDGAATPLETKEFGYEQKAAIVTEERPGWYRLLLAERQPGWVTTGGQRRFLGIAALFRDRPLQAHREWDGAVYSGPGASPEPPRPDLLRAGFRMLRVEQHHGVWWMLTEFPVQDIC